MIDHNDFRVNEAWVVFKLNEVPLLTQDGGMNMYALMDIGSGYIIGHISSSESSVPDKKEVKKLFLKAWKEKSDWPYKLILEEDNIQMKAVKQFAKNNGISLQQSSASELGKITSDPKKAFANHF
ncbi:hypothetical protein [Neptunomonas phycophila]|uniref:hypothetical protein n=1 Tax=Neptunomonas phycophila TaxID=1572645 RepID=UPI001BE8EF0A|nr:hypothetical protein [Neptunomonas phycophila]MBT3144865.1 hypothetical protein [Neptunomonas phycophila]